MNRTLSSRALLFIAMAGLLFAGLLAQPGHADAAACTGAPLVDSLDPACGLRIEAGAHLIEWDRPEVRLGDVLTSTSLSFVRNDHGESSSPRRALQVWREVRPGVWRGWMGGITLGLRTLEPGQRYWFVAEYELAWALPARASVLEGSQVVGLYGHPGVPAMGILGRFTAAGAAREAARVAAEYDALNGARNVTPALHLIASVAQASPGDGTYLGRMSAKAVDEYVRVTREHSQLLVLDIQVGWGDPLAEVRRYAAALTEPHVHVALDPEFATRSDGNAPGQSIGSLTAEAINEVQRYLAALAAERGLPPKMLIVHQFRDDMVERPDRIEVVDGVDLVIDMDGFGPRAQKLWGYDRFAHSSYAEYAGFKLFYDWDINLFSPREVQALAPAPPDYVLYQ